MSPTVDEVLAPGYLDGLPGRDLADVRSMRDGCQEVEGGLSFVRRMVHGRLDIVGAELTRRREGGDPADLGELVARLPDLLSEREPAASRRSPRALDVGTVPDDLRDELDGIVGTDELARLRELSTDDLDALAGRLVEFERWVSERRRGVQDRLDQLQAEIARRYREGEASVDSLLE
jgi:hypothetical protein